MLPICSFQLRIPQLQQLLVTRLFELGQLSQAMPASVLSTHKCQLAYCFTQTILAHTLYISKRMQSFSIHSCTQLFSRINFTPRTLVSQSSVALYPPKLGPLSTQELKEDIVKTYIGEDGLTLIEEY